MKSGKLLDKTTKTVIEYPGFEPLRLQPGRGSGVWKAKERGVFPPQAFERRGHLAFSFYYHAERNFDERHQAVL